MGQPAYLKEEQKIFKTFSYGNGQICVRHSPCQNPPPPSRNKPAGAAPTEGSGTPTPTSAAF